MRISIFGLGYVGCVSAACLARDGHSVIGVDVNPQKAEMVGAGTSPIIEPGLDELLKKVVAAGKLTVSMDGCMSVLDTDVSMVCVGTPSRRNGSLSTRFVENVCCEIGTALAQKAAYHTVVIRSTVLPGTVRDILIPLLENRSGKKAGVDFGVSMNPEFLRESSAIKDYYQHDLVVIGELDSRSGDAVAEAYTAVNAQIVRTSIETAEMIKYVNNAFHALKVTFANEIGEIAKAHGVDGREVMDVLCQDRRLNISPAYLRPGFAFGGSCLPKDVRALAYRARQKDIDAYLLESLLPSNEHQIRRGIQLIEQTGCKKIAVFGLSFKAGTDDVRESPMIPLIETLVGRGYSVQVYDEKVEIANLIGANKSYLESEIPHITSLMSSSLAETVANAEVIVIANNSPAFHTIPTLLSDSQIMIDLVGIDKVNGNIRGNYEGICW